MHELSIAQALLEHVEATAAKEQALRVVRVAITVGALSGVDAESLRSLFPLVAEGTLAAGADLAIEPVAARVRCRACGHEAQPEPASLGCAACGSAAVELTAGRELNITAIELEIDER